MHLVLERTSGTPLYRQVAEQIRDYQERRGLSDAALCREFAGLGSTKTYKRILEGDFSELNVERQLENYLRVLEENTRCQ